MGKLDHLKIKQAPAAFMGWARNFNQQVDLLGSIQGGPGLDVKIAIPMQRAATSKTSPKPKEQPRGKILFSIRPSAITGLGVGGNSVPIVQELMVGPAGYVYGINVVGAAVNSGYFPTTLRTNATAGGVNYFQADNSGVLVQGITNHSTFIQNDVIYHYGPNAGASNFVQVDHTGIAVRSATNTCYIVGSDIHRDLSIRTFVGCNSGNAANYLVLASDFF